jgi:rsbT co-antagonist protein RsbR
MSNQLPIDITATNTLNSIGENILIADTDFKITWMNRKAIQSLQTIAPYYGLSRAEDMIGLNMDHFHRSPDYQRGMMKELGEGHRARIMIAEKIAADIVITPIYPMEDTGEIEGYMVMLMDVTSQAEEQKRKDQMIKELQVPIIHIWENTIALPLLGDIDIDRGDHLISMLLEECTSKQIEFVLLSLGGVKQVVNHFTYTIQSLHDCLRLIGVELILVEITPELALNIKDVFNVRTFRSANAGLKNIMKLQGNAIRSHGDIGSL